MCLRSNAQASGLVARAHSTTTMRSCCHLSQVAVPSGVEIPPLARILSDHHQRVEYAREQFLKQNSSDDQCTFISKWIFILPWIVQDTAKMFDNVISLNANEQMLLGFRFNKCQQTLVEFHPSIREIIFNRFRRSKNLTVTMGGVFQRSYSPLTFYRLEKIDNKKVTAGRSSRCDQKCWRALLFRVTAFRWKFRRLCTACRISTTMLVRIFTLARLIRSNRRLFFVNMCNDSSTRIPTERGTSAFISSLSIDRRTAIHRLIINKHAYYSAPYGGNSQHSLLVEGAIRISFFVCE